MYVCQCILWMCKNVHILIHLCNFISIQNNFMIPLTYQDTHEELFIFEYADG